MKLFNVFLYICCVFFMPVSSDAQVDNTKLQGVIETVINATINKFIKELDDPVMIPSSYERFNNLILTGWLNISNFKFVGLKSIAASYINVQYNLLDPSPTNLTITIENLNLFFNYETSLIVGQLLPFFGKGNVSANLDTVNIKLDTMADVVLIPPSFRGFKNSLIELTVGENTGLHIEGILHSDVVSKWIDNFLGTFISRFIDFMDSNKERIRNVISPIFQSILDSIFKE